MNYEKAYKEALERAREFQKSKDGLCVLTAESIFPELKDSKDERIRKALVRFHKSTIDVDGIKGEDIIAWLEKQGEPTTIDIDKMVLKYSQTRESCTNGLPVNCQIRAYRQGINDTLRLSFNLEKQGEQKHTDRVEPKFKVGDIVKFDRPSAMLKREILSIDFENERYLTRRTDIGGSIKEFIYFCEQDDYVIVGSHNNNPSLEDKVSILADEIIALKERVKALEIQVIKQCSDKNRLDSLESKMIILDSYNINNRLDALESSVLEEGK